MTFIANCSTANSVTFCQLSAEDELAHSYPAHPVIHTSVPEPWQVNTLMLGNPVIGLGMLTGTLSLLLAFLGMRLRQLAHCLKRRDREIEALSLTDPLTGLANRRQLAHIGNQLLAQPAAADITLLYLNIDRFKAINDELGHIAGDELLCAIAQRLQAHVQPHQTLARIGGDEFALLLCETESADVRQVSRDVLSSLSQPFSIQNQAVSVSASLGVAQSKFMAQSSSDGRFDELLIQGNGSALAISTRPCGPLSPSQTNFTQPSFSQLLTQADIAMSKAKVTQEHSESMPYVHGQYEQSRYAVFHPVIQAEVLTQVKLQGELAKAIDRKELRVHYQPIVDLRDSRLIGFEALVRWQHPERGLLFPGDFLPLAEEMGLAIAIDRWVMRAACQQLMIWRQTMNRLPSLSINLTGAHLAHPDLVNYIQQLLSRYPISACQLNLEVTESVMIVDPDKAIDTLRRIKALGISVSLDDFGTGYSSLCYLHQLPADVLKIDRSFVSCLGEEEQSNQQTDYAACRTVTQTQLLPNQCEVIIKAILDLAADLNIRVVAEGIECDAQRQQLQKMHCHYGQGHLFSKPIRASLAHKLLV